MTQQIHGWPWEGREYNEQLSPRYTNALSRAILDASVEAVTHPGVVPPATYADAATPWVNARPAPMLPAAERQRWLQILGVEGQGIGEGSGG